MKSTTASSEKTSPLYFKYWQIYKYALASCRLVVVELQTEKEKNERNNTHS